MNYEIIFNIPNEKDPTKVEISEEQLSRLEGKLNSKSIIKIGDSYYNTAYIVKIVPRKEMVMLNEHYLIAGRNERKMTTELESELHKLKSKVKKIL